MINTPPKTNEMDLTRVYREALCLHRISFNEREKTRGLFNFKRFDDSHLPKGYDDPLVWQKINDKLTKCICWENVLSSGVFNCTLTFNEALILLVKPNYDNINYMKERDINLQRYKLGASMFNISIV